MTKIMYHRKEHEHWARDYIIQTCQSKHPNYTPSHWIPSLNPIKYHQSNNQALSVLTHVACSLDCHLALDEVILLKLCALMSTLWVRGWEPAPSWPMLPSSAYMFVKTSRRWENILSCLTAHFLTASFVRELSVHLIVPCPLKGVIFTFMCCFVSWEGTAWQKHMTISLIP